jgi:hypothetical protein
MRAGALKSESDIDIVADHGYDEATGQTTVSATLEDITGLTFDVVIPTGYTGRVAAMMVVQCSTTGGAPATGGWAIDINGTDGTEIQRYLSGTNDTGSLSCQARSVSLAAGTYTVQGRHRRASGTSTVNSDVAQLIGWAILEAVA